MRLTRKRSGGRLFWGLIRHIPFTGYDDEAMRILLRTVLRLGCVIVRREEWWRRLSSCLRQSLVLLKYPLTLINI